MICEKIKKQLFFYKYELLNITQMDQVRLHIEKCNNCLNELEFIETKSELIDLTYPDKIIDTKMSDRILNNADNYIDTEMDLKKRNILKDIQNLFNLKLGFAVMAVTLLLFTGYFINSYYGNSFDIKVSNIIYLNNKKIDYNKRLTGNAYLYTPENTTAKINKIGFLDIDINEKTKLYISSIKRIWKEKVNIKINNGYANINITPQKGELTIKTINATVEVIGTKFEIFVDENKIITKIIMHKGCTEIYNNKKSANKIKALKGDIIIIRGEDMPEIIHKKEISVYNRIDKYNEKIYLRNGNVVIGKIIEQNDDIVLIKTEVGTLKYNAGFIQKVEYIK